MTARRGAGIGRRKERHPEGGARFRGQDRSSGAGASTGELAACREGPDEAGLRKRSVGEERSGYPRPELAGLRAGFSVTGCRIELGKPGGWGAADQERSYTPGRLEGRTSD